MHTCVHEDAHGSQKMDIRRISMSEQAKLVSARIRRSGFYTYLENCIQNKYPINHEKSRRAWMTDIDGGTLAYRRIYMADKEWIFGEYPRTSGLVRECPDTKQ